MSRIAISAQEQVVLLREIQENLGLSQVDLADACYVHRRTFSDWCRGKTRMRYEALELLTEHEHLKLDEDIPQLPEYSHVRRAARLGGIRRNAVHGNPGTAEGRKRGGVNSSARFQEIAARGEHAKFSTLKSIRYPEPSGRLAELFGVLLGDGCLGGKYQVMIYFNARTDIPYAAFIEKLVVELFNVKVSRSIVPNSGEGALVISSKRLVEYLCQLGFPRGDKVKVQVAVPGWIQRNPEYRRNCLRGLVDTDGSFYSYRHVISGKPYIHLAMCFTNRSFPLLGFVKEALRHESLCPTSSGFHVYLYRRSNVEHYFQEVGTHNTKYLDKWKAWLDGMGRGV